MKRVRSFLIIIASFSSNILVAQEETPEFGHVTLSDFAATPFDSTSSSVVLFDKGIYGGTIFDPVVEYHIRVKIISQNAFQLWGDFELHDSNGFVEKVKAATYYLENGKIISDILEKDAILRDRSRRKIVPLRNLREGCVVELSYKIHTNFFSMPSWIIQGDAPVLWSEYRLLSPAKLTYIIRGPFEPYIYEPKYKGGYSRWVFRNVPAFAREPLMPDPVNYLARLEFWNPSDSWDKVNDDYLTRYKSWLFEFHYEIKGLKIKKLLDSTPDSIQKVERLVKYVKDNYRWTEYLSYTPFIRSQIFKEKKGSSGELNMLLYALLQEAGLKPDFVLLSTADNGFPIEDIVSADQFNYVLCSLMLGNQRYFLDATDPILPFNVVPVHCVNTKGLVISKKGPSWVLIEPEFKERLNVNAWLTILGDQDMKGKVTTLRRGYDAYADHIKLNLLGKTDFRKECVPDNLWVIDSTSVPALKMWDSVSVITHYAKIPGLVMNLEDKIYVNPYIMVVENRNSFQDHDRKYPVFLQRKIEKRLMVYFAVPEGFRINSMPGSRTFSMPDQSITCSFITSSDGKSVVVIYLLKVNKTWFATEEYGNLREFFNLILAKQNEMVILEKAL